MDATGKITIEEALKHIEMLKQVMRNGRAMNCTNRCCWYKNGSCSCDEIQNSDISTFRIGGREYTICNKCEKIKEKDNMSNVVQVRFLQDPSKKRYTFNVPCNEEIHKGDVVRIKNKNNSEMIAIAETDSEMLSENAIDMIMGGKEVISWVIGKYEYSGFLNLNITTETITISNN